MRNNRASDLTGYRFERLVVIKRCGSKGKSALWCCLCDCGEEVKVEGGHLKGKSTKSCGCLNKDEKKARSENRSIEAYRLTHMHSLMRDYRHSAKKRGHEFALSENDFRDIDRKSTRLNSSH